MATVKPGTDSAAFESKQVPEETQTSLFRESRNGRIVLRNAFHLVVVDFSATVEQLIVHLASTFRRANVNVLP